MRVRTMTTTVTVPAGGSPYHPIEQRTTTTTMTSVRGKRLRLFITGLAQLTFGGFCLIPVLLLGSLPVTISACACLAFTGMAGILCACFTDSELRSTVVIDRNTGAQTVVTQRPILPRIYIFFVVVGFFLAVASAIQGIVMVASGYTGDIRTSTSIGTGVFLALNQMLMFCCVASLGRRGVSSTEQVSSQPVIVGGLPVSSAYQPVFSTSYLAPAGAVAGASSPTYPYIDDQPKEDYPPSYHEATRQEHMRASAPPEKV